MKFFPSTSTISRSDLVDRSSNYSLTEVNNFNSGELVSTVGDSALDRTISTKLAKTEHSDWSPSLNQLLEEPPASFPQLVTLGAIGFCLTFFAWAWLGKIDEVSKAYGKLTPRGKTYKVESVELGKVKHIAVREAEQVKAGQPLVELDPELTIQEVTRLEQMIQAYQSELRQKKALRNKLVLEAKTSSDISQAEIAAQNAAILLAEEKADSLNYLLNLQQSEAKAFADKQVSLKPLPNLARERLNQLEAEKLFRQQRLDKLKTLAQQGAVSQEYVFQVEQSLREAERQITQSQLQEFTDTREQIFQSDRDTQELQARIINSQTEFASALKEAEMLKAELIQKQADGKRVQLEIQQKTDRLEFEIAQIESKIVDTQNLLSAAKSKLQQRSLTAPVDGIVSSLNVDNAGKVIQAGETVVEIAPIDVPLILAASIPNSEAGFIEEGMPVQLKMNAYPYEYYGLIPGEVSKISADAKLDPELGEVYQIEIELERDHVIDNSKKVKFQAGQTATADIVIRRRRILDVWLEPIKRLQQDGMEI